MSDLYLLLRRRLEEVVDWVHIDSSVLKEARERKGLSYETMARLLPVSAKTWERYEKQGRVPRPLLTKIARILDLEIEEATRLRVLVDGPDEEEAEFDVRLAAFEAEQAAHGKALAEQRALLDEIAELLRRRLGAAEG